MSAQYDFPQLEQDVYGPGDDLPTYDDLALQSGPNSRFGRWRGWIEKRAAERYHDISPEELTRRRARGWGDDVDSNPLDGSQLTDSPISPNEVNGPPTPSPSSLPLHLRIHTDLPSLPPQEDTDTPPSDKPLSSSRGERLSPSRLIVNQFGSRFLPHAANRIRCLLPLMNDRLLLIGHDEGLSVLDMFPQEWTETGNITTKGPDEANARLMWEGEAVHQMSLLEFDSVGKSTPQGVVLALVGPEVEGSKDQESLRTLRMYNLASLLSLAKYVVSQKGARPVDIHRPAKWDSQQSPAKKHRTHSSIAKGLLSFIEPPVAQSAPHSSSYQSLMPPVVQPDRATIVRTKSIASDSTWDIVEDLPLRWATDYVGLAAAGSRLLSTSVNCYSLWRESNNRSQGVALLAVATRSNILLYEKPKGERAFRFVKEFYTPLPARNLTFIQQSVQDVTRSVSDVGPSSSWYQSSGATDTLQDVRSPKSTRSPTLKYSPQLSLFVVFDKKAGVIRLSDSTVGEVELANDSVLLNPDFLHTRELSSSPSTLSRRPRMSEVHGSSKGRWALPSRMDLPAATSGRQPSLPRSVYFLTRGKQTNILPSPLPATISNYPSLLSLTWESPPSSVTPRICHPPEDGAPPFLQLVALGDGGVEVQELSLSFLNRGKGKGRAEAPVRSSLDISAGFLCTGGHWHQPNYSPQMTRSHSVASDVSGTSFGSLDSDELVSKLKLEQGIYGWCQKDIRDWRVFWVGGTGREERDDDNRQ